MKNFLYGLAVGAMVVAFMAGLLDSAAETQAIREVAGIKNGMRHCSQAGTGAHCYLEGNKELVVITARGTK